MSSHLLDEHYFGADGVFVLPKYSTLLVLDSRDFDSLEELIKRFISEATFELTCFTLNIFEWVGLGLVWNIDWVLDTIVVLRNFAIWLRFRLVIDLNSKVHRDLLTLNMIQLKTILETIIAFSVNDLSIIIIIILLRLGLFCCFFIILALKIDLRRRAHV